MLLYECNLLNLEIIKMETFNPHDLKANKRIIEFKIIPI